MLSDLKFRWRAVFDRRAMDRELGDEVRFHIERETAKLVAAGVAPDEAFRRARLAFGGVDRISEEARDARGIHVIETVRQDMRYAWRGLTARPGFAIAIVLALALGIGANTAMFSIVDRLLFRPPAYLLEPSRVNRVFLTWTSDGRANTDRSLNYTRYEDFARWTTSFDKVAVTGYRTVAIGDGGAARDMVICAASASLFDLFALRPVIGRFYGANEDRVPAGAPVAVLTYAFWQSHFGGRADVIGTRLHVGTITLTVIGVAPPGFVGITEDQPPVLFAPVTALAAARSTDFYSTYHWSWLDLFVQRKPGVTVAAANADLTTAFERSWRVQAAVDHLPPSSLSHPRAEVTSIHLSRGPAASADSKVAQWVMGVALIVLLIACANVANLLLARAVGREREIALRVALGVSRDRLIQQLVTESVLLAALGGIAGLLVAGWGGRVLRAMFIKDGDVGPLITDTRTLAFVAAATMSVAILTGIAPAIHALRADVNSALKGGSRGNTYRRSRSRTTLLLFQATLSVVLLVGAGLFTRSLSNVRSTRLGYDVDSLLLVDGNMRDVKLTAAEQNALNRRLLAAAQAAPGVISATVTTSVPFYSSEGRGAPIVAGRDSLGTLGKFLLQAGTVDYFKTIGTRIIQGRGFLDTDRENTLRVAVVSQAMARLVWPGENVIGKQFRLDSDTTTPLTVVGVAENMNARRLRDSGEIWYYLPLPQYERYFGASYPDFFVRVSGKADDRIDQLRGVLQSQMPGSSYLNVISFASIVGRQEQAWKFGATMFVAFGGLALLLAAIGLYSVIAYGVAQRTRELGVRIALGASTRTVVMMIVGQGVGFAVAGIAIGSAVALASSRWVEPILFNQSAKDPAVYLEVGAGILAVAIIASAWPAIRAMRVNPNEVLRSD